MAQPLVSIITVTYNSEKYLEQTIKSVIEQDYPRIEHILVDGGSTDGTMEIIIKYSGRIAKWVSEPDRGPTEAINKGVLMSSGEIIALLNSDDYYADNSVISKIVETFNRFADIKMLYGIVEFIDPETEEPTFQWGRDFEPSEIRKRMYLPTPTIFSRREVWDNVGHYREEYNYADDYEWAIRALKFTRPYFLNHVITRMREIGRSDENYREALAETARALREHGFYLDSFITSTRNLIKTVLIELGLKGLVWKVWQRNVRPRGS